MTSDPTYRDLLYFLNIAVCYCICCNGLFGAILLRLFYFPNFLHLDWHDLSTTPQQLGTDYTGCVTSLVMMGKSVCPSCQKQRECLEYYCTSEIYRDITLLSASTVDSIYNGFYIVFLSSRAAPLRATRVRGRHGSSATAPQVLPGDEPARVEELRRASALCVDAPYERIRPASKVNINVHLSVCLCQIFAHQFNLVTFTRQHGGNKLYYGKLRCRFKRLLSAYWIKLPN